ncbi:MAG: lytic murein transglycosylase B [Gammaproteobacteria bacterium]|nr:MAG: lytic murein transglycosylase B [Gammaproteobacteria bacterium]TND06327.1 MAG: lytic murein transglycosylase B [Gammaproteobacteria bacterium]
MSHIRKFIPILAISVMSCAGAVTADGFTNRTDIQTFIDELVTRHGFERQSLKTLFDNTERRQDIIDAISRPAEAKPWHQYRPIFLNTQRISGGVEFWNQHAALLDKAEQVYGVPPEIVTAIIGVETRYGASTGRYRVMDSLATLAFDYPPRAAFFRGELEQFLLLAREEAADPLSIKGSYAGAMGQGQFISSSYRHYAVDFDGDGKRDLWNSTADAIGSVANYFHVHGWKPGEPVASRARVQGNAYKELVAQDLKPHTSLAQLQTQGVTASDTLPPDALAALIELETENGVEHWLGLDNFYVITRYNRSRLYAMAVYQLSQEIRSQRPGALNARSK